MKRLLCYAHFDLHGEVKPFVTHALVTMAPMCNDIRFVSNSPVTKSEINTLKEICSEVIVNPNTGYDFYMWKSALMLEDYSQFDEIILMNSSIYGPLFPMDEIFSTMESRDCDFWGITECFQMQPHVQSYFLVFKKTVLTSIAFSAFWNNVQPYVNKLQIIMSYEVGLTQWLVESGFKADVYCNFTQLGYYCHSIGKRLRKKDNSSVKHAGELLEIGNPFLKRDAVRKKFINDLVYHYLDKHSYSLALIDEGADAVPIKCPLCKTTGKRSHKGVRDYLNMHNVERYDYYRCQNNSCSVVWLEPPPPNYASEYHNRNITTRLHGPVFQRQCLIKRFPPAIPFLILGRGIQALFNFPKQRCLMELFGLDMLPPGKVLVVEPDMENRKHILKKLGWEVTSLESHTTALTLLKDATPPITNGDGPSRIIDSANYDAIVLSGVFERTRDVSGLLAECCRLLRHGGRLAISTPNSYAFTGLLFGRCWFGLNAPRNMIIHTSRSLKTVLRDAGFELTAIRTCSLNSEVFAMHSVDALVHKWTSLLSAHRLGRELLPITIQIMSSVLNTITRKHGDICLVTAVNANVQEEPQQNS